METENLASATLYYLKRHPRWAIEKPYTLFADVSKIEGALSTNIVKEAVEQVPIVNVRSRKHDLSLDVNGFEVISSSDGFSAGSFEDPKWVEDVYYPSVCNMVKERLGAKDVRCYEHKAR